MSAWRSVSAVFLIAIGSWAAAGSAAAAASGPADFIAALGNQAIYVLQTIPDLPGREAALSKLLTAGFDVPAIGKYVLGPAWNTATPAQQSDYLDLFGKYTVAIYAERFANYSGGQFKVLASHGDDQPVATVTSQIIHQDGSPPSTIEWQVAREGEGYKITNVIFQGLSMVQSQRQEFASVLAHNGNSIDALDGMLKAKIQAP